MFGLPLSEAEDEAKRNEDDKARVFEIIKTLPPVGPIAYVTTRFKSSSASKPPPVQVKFTATPYLSAAGTRNHILKHASKLRGSTWSSVFFGT